MFLTNANDTMASSIILIALTTELRTIYTQSTKVNVLLWQQETLFGSIMFDQEAWLDSIIN